MSASDRLLSRAGDELRAARLLAVGDLPAQAVARAYYAAFYAAEAALLDVGETRSKHSGVIAAFIQVVVRQKGCDETAGRLLRDLFQRRAQADYTTDPVPADEATRAIADAEAVITAIVRWQDERTA